MPATALGHAAWRRQRPNLAIREHVSPRPPTRLPAAVTGQEPTTAPEPDNDSSAIPIPKLTYAPVRPLGGTAFPLHTHTHAGPSRGATLLSDAPPQAGPELRALGIGSAGAFGSDLDARSMDSKQMRMSQHQLEELATSVLGPDSYVWSADARNRPAGTSRSHVSDADIASFVASSEPKQIAQRIDELTALGDIGAARRLLAACSPSQASALFNKISYRQWHKALLQAAPHTRSAACGLQLLRTVPHGAPTKRVLSVLTSVLEMCALCRDLDAAFAAMDWASQMPGMKLDVMVYTALMKACKSVGNVDKAYMVFLQMKQSKVHADAHAYGVLIATCAEAMKRDLNVVHERKEQYVLLERAFQYVSEAEAAGVVLTAPVWNSLMLCAGRSGELNRAFEVLRMMQARDVTATAATYGCLLESCVIARQPDKALRVFEVALGKGHTHEVKLYTQAITACLMPGQPAGSWGRALDIFVAAQRAGVRPDKKFFAALISLAGRTGHLESALTLMEDMMEEGVAPSSTTIGAMVHACLERDNLALARRVYDLASRRGVYPGLSQFNRLMEAYAAEGRFGEVVSLVCDLVRTGLRPNLNTYRVIINACARADQAGLAFQVFQVMQSRKVNILQQKFAQTIYYGLIKACFNQSRYLWAPPGGYPPAAPGTPMLRAAPQVRQAEAEALLEALTGSRRLRTSPHTGSPFDGPPDAIDWTSHAVNAFHHMLSRGHKPSITILDKLLNCTRAKLLPAEQDPAASGVQAAGVAAGGPDAAQQHQQAHAQQHAVAPAITTSPFVHYRRASLFEVAFEPRAFSLLEEAVSRGLLPRYEPDAPLVMDMRGLPPTVSEVYVANMLLSLERHASRAAAKAAAQMAQVTGQAGPREATKKVFLNSITLLVPPFDPDLTTWPSYVGKLVHKYTLDEEEQARLRRRMRRRVRRRPYLAAAQGAPGGGMPEEDDEDEVHIPDPEPDPEYCSEDDDSMLCRVDWDHESLLDAGAPYSGQYVADSTTGLAVAGTLRRMKVWMNVDHVNGVISIKATELIRWLKWLRNFKRQAHADAAAAAVAEQGGPAAAAAAAAAGQSPAPGPVGIGGGVGTLPAARPSGAGFGASAMAPLEQQQWNIRADALAGQGPGSAARPGGFGAGAPGPFGLPSRQPPSRMLFGSEGADPGAQFRRPSSAPAPAAGAGTEASTAAHSDAQARSDAPAGSSSSHAPLREPLNGYYYGRSPRAGPKAAPAAPAPAELSPPPAAQQQQHQQGKPYLQQHQLHRPKSRPAARPATTGSAGAPDHATAASTSASTPGALRYKIWVDPDVAAAGAVSSSGRASSPGPHAQPEQQQQQQQPAMRVDPRLVRPNRPAAQRGSAARAQQQPNGASEPAQAASGAAELSVGPDVSVHINGNGMPTAHQGVAIGGPTNGAADAAHSV